MVSTMALENMDRARVEVAAERQRAGRCADLADRHERLAVTGLATMRPFHERAASSNRQMQQRHLVAAGIHAAHLARLRASVHQMLLPSADSARPRRNGAATAHGALAADLPAAIDRGELLVEYQPIISLTDGRLVGVEALVRWQHPRLGLLPPDRFIDLAEESGMIGRLGQTVLAQACGAAAHWPRATPDAPFVSVNVTAGQLQDPDLVGQVTTVLDEVGLPASRLHLEILEGAIVHPGGRSISTLRDLVDLGITIAIDDFGTGYSNLSYLRRLPVKTIKIDRAFVADLCPPVDGPDDAGTEILVAIVSLARTIGLTVIAEGVESAVQAEWLQSIGVDAAQGWHFGRPTGADTIRAAITR